MESLILSEDWMGGEVKGRWREREGREWELELTGIGMRKHCFKKKIKLKKNKH